MRKFIPVNKPLITKVDASSVGKVVESGWISSEGTNIKRFEDITLGNKVSFSLFSPPYVNCFDYFEVYKIELWFGDFINNYDQLRLLRKKQ